MEPNSIEAYAERLYEHMAVMGYSPSTILTWRHIIKRFTAWCREREIYTPFQVTRELLERYQRHIFRYRKEDGTPLAFSTQLHVSIALRGYFKFLAKKHYLVYNPAAELDMPRKERTLPRYVLTQEEAELIISQPDVTKPYGIRDRAILETLYSTGIRRMEVANLKIFDIDFRDGTMMVRQGKGKKDRMVPIGKRALLWIEKYLREVRPKLVYGIDENYLFITQFGEPLTKESLGILVSDHVKQSKIGKPGGCHLFRHTMATLMLENGADIRYIQHMLGHACLDTTQIYTHVSIKKLKEIHEAVHPAKMERTRNINDEQSPADARDSLAVSGNEQKDSQTNQAPGSSQSSSHA